MFSKALAHLRRRGALAFAAVLAIALAGCGGDEDTTTNPTFTRPPDVGHTDGGQPAITEASLSAQRVIERVGREWASRFAAHHHAPARYTAQPALEREACQRISGPIENCTPPTAAFRRSFEGATVEKTTIQGNHAAAKFSNGESVQFVRIQVGDPCIGSGCPRGGKSYGWLVSRFGEDAD